MFDILSFSLGNTTPSSSSSLLPLCVTLTTQASHGSWAVPLLVRTDGTQMMPINVIETSARTAEGWVTVKWVFEESAHSLSSLRIALCHSIITIILARAVVGVVVVCG